MRETPSRSERKYMVSPSLAQEGKTLFEIPSLTRTLSLPSARTANIWLVFFTLA